MFFLSISYISPLSFTITFFYSTIKFLHSHIPPFSHSHIPLLRSPLYHRPQEDRHWTASSSSASISLSPLSA